MSTQEAKPPARKRARSDGKHTIILVRHGEYKTWVQPARFQDLTPLGEDQAMKTAPVLESILKNCPRPECIESSEMIRAITTAQIINKVLLLNHKISRSLNEGDPADKDVGARLHTIFTNYFVPTSTDKTDVLVCHGNVIRYLICRLVKDNLTCIATVI